MGFVATLACRSRLYTCTGTRLTPIDPQGPRGREFPDQELAKYRQEEHTHEVMDE